MQFTKCLDVRSGPSFCCIYSSLSSSSSSDLQFSQRSASALLSSDASQSDLTSNCVDFLTVPSDEDDWSSKLSSSLLLFFSMSCLSIYFDTWLLVIDLSLASILLIFVFSSGLPFWISLLLSSFFDRSECVAGGSVRFLFSNLPVLVLDDSFMFSLLAVTSMWLRFLAKFLSGILSEFFFDSEFSPTVYSIISCEIDFWFPKALRLLVACFLMLNVEFPISSDSCFLSGV